MMGGVWLPSGSILNRVKGHVGLAGASELTLSQGCAYGVEGWILPVEDPDSVQTMNAIWDDFVPKDTTSDILDLDTATPDSNTFYEPGMIAWEFLFDVGTQPRRILHRHRMCSPANSMIMNRQDTETPFIEHWFPGANERIDVRRPIRVSGPSLAVFAVAVPDSLATSATTPVAALGEDRWGQIKYIDNVLERAMMDLLGLTEAGAETPWEEASDLLRSYLEANVLEANAGTMVQMPWTAIGELVFDVIVPGRMPTKILTGGR